MHMRTGCVVCHLDLDFVLKIYFPKGGTMFIYALTLILLLARPQGLFGKKSA